MPCISESCIEIKIELNFYFHTSWWSLKRFCERLKGLHKTFWGTTNTCENKNLSFSLRPGLGREGLKVGFNVNIFHKTFQKIEKWLATVCIYNWNFDERWHRMQNIKTTLLCLVKNMEKLLKFFTEIEVTFKSIFFISIHGDNRLTHHLIKTISQRICRKNMAGKQTSYEHDTSTACQIEQRI